MNRRIDGLVDIDPLAVPLPHGTEVTTRVDRVAGARVIPQGTAGRVVGIEGDRFDVQIVGVGAAVYTREELTPRKVGQMRYARRRAAAWDTLRPCTVLEATVGSRAWGLADDASDTDLRGAFALPLAWTLGLSDPPLDLVSADASATYWETAKLIRQALRSDPNTLELLFVPSVRALDPIGKWILEAREAFVSVEIHGSFGRYALSQLDRLTQGQRLVRHRGAVLDWLRGDPTLTLDALAARLATLDLRADVPTADREHLARESIKQLCRSMFDQGLIAGRDFSALVGFALRGGSHDLPRELRPKNAYNLLRLLATAIQWLETGTPEFEAKGALRDQLLAIKRGEVELEAVLDAARALTPRLEHARRAGVLPARPDVARADALMKQIGHEIARRYVFAEAGAWGRDAPPAPIAQWDDEGA